MSKQELSLFYPVISELQLQRRKNWRKQTKSCRAYSKGIPESNQQRELSLGRPDFTLRNLPLHPKTLEQAASTPAAATDISIHEPQNQNHYWPASRKTHPHIKRTIHTTTYQHPLNAAIRVKRADMYEI